MRNELSKMDNIRTHFVGTFERYGSRKAYRGAPIKTILLKNVKQGDKNVADHLWFTETQGFRRLGFLYPGERVSFEARVSEYIKGYKGYDEEKQFDAPLGFDYRLSYPTKVERFKGET